MKVVVAIDSFKGSMTSLEAGNMVREAILCADPLAEVVVLPLADGGEGTVRALTEGTGGDIIQAKVTGPLGEPVSCVYGITPGRTAVLEMAACSGLTLVPEERRNPLYTSTYGLGELIVDAVGRGCKNFVIGIGGSATHDLGLGMLTALGFRFKDKSGKPLPPCGKSLSDVAAIDDSAVDKRVYDCRFRIACDVNNPLLGENGAARVYAPQKGATPEIVSMLEMGSAHFASVASDGRDCELYPGAGAAGGLGYAFLRFLNSSLERGIEIILDEIGIKEHLRDAHYVVTGEGRLDSQTAMGKAPIGVAKLAQKYGATVIGFAGITADDAEICNREGIDAYFSIMRAPVDLLNAMDASAARANLFETARQVFYLLRKTQTRKASLE